MTELEKQILFYCERQVSRGTAKTYQYILICFLRFWHDNPPKNWFDTYLPFLQRSGLSNKTINMHIVIIRKFYERVLKVTDQPPFQRLKETAPEITFLKDDEVNKLLTAASPDFLPILKFFLDTGVRVAELAWVSNQKYSVVPDQFVVLGKGHIQRVVVVSEGTRKLLKPGFVFGEPLSIRQIQYQFKKLGRSVGLPNIHVHQLRHTFATSMLEKGASLSEIQEMLGHSFLQTTAMYTHVTKERLRRVWERYHTMVKI